MEFCYLYLFFLIIYKCFGNYLDFEENSEILLSNLTTFNYDEINNLIVFGLVNILYIF